MILKSTMTSILSLHDNIVYESYSFGFMFLCMHNVSRESAYQIMQFYKKLVCRKDFILDMPLLDMGPVLAQFVLELVILKLNN